MSELWHPLAVWARNKKKEKNGTRARLARSALRPPMDMVRGFGEGDPRDANSGKNLEALVPLFDGGRGMIS
jgi:hypothetical protein